MKTSINSKAPVERFVHIHAEAVNERIREALGTNQTSGTSGSGPVKKHSAADSRKKSANTGRMDAAHFFAGPHCVFFAR